MKNTFGFLLIAILFMSVVSCGKKTTAPKEEKVINMVLSLQSIDFGKVKIGQQRDTTFSIENKSNSNAKLVGSVSITGDGFQILGTTSFSLDPGKKHVFTVQFAPNQSGSVSGSISIDHNATNLDKPATINLNGIGEAPVIMHVDNTPIDFGVLPQGQSAQKQISIGNDAGSGENLQGGVSVSGSDFALVSGGTTFNIAPGDSVVLQLQFTASAQATSSGSLQITHNADNMQSPLVISLEGRKDLTADIRALIQQGWDAFVNQDYGSAHSLFQKGLTLIGSVTAYDSLKAEAYVGRGWSNGFLRDYVTSRSDFKRALGISVISQSAQQNAYAGLVIVGYALNEYEEAINNALLILGAAPDYVFSYDNRIDFKKIRLVLAQSYYSIGNFTEAAAQLDILDPANAPHSTQPDELLKQIQEVAQSI